MIDDEKAAVNVGNKKKKPDYKPYDEPEFDEFGMAKPKEILDKYDEEIEGKKYEKFQLGAGGKYNAEHERRMLAIQNEVRQQGVSIEIHSPDSLHCELVSFFIAQKPDSFVLFTPKFHEL